MLGNIGSQYIRMKLGPARLKRCVSFEPESISKLNGRAELHRWTWAHQRHKMNLFGKIPHHKASWLCLWHIWDCWPREHSYEGQAWQGEEPERGSCLVANHVTKTTAILWWVSCGKTAGSLLSCCLLYLVDWTWLRMRKPAKRWSFFGVLTSVPNNRSPISSQSHQFLVCMSALASIRS